MITKTNYSWNEDSDLSRMKVVFDFFDEVAPRDWEVIRTRLRIPRDDHESLLRNYLMNAGFTAEYDRTRAKWNFNPFFKGFCFERNHGNYIFTPKANGLSLKVSAEASGQVDWASALDLQALNKFILTGEDPKLK